MSFRLLSPVLAALALASAAVAAPIPGGSLFVSQAAGTSTTGVQASVAVFQTDGRLQRTIEIPKGRIQLQGLRGGRLALSPDGKLAGLAGYIPPFSGTGNLNTRTHSEAPRGFVTINLKGGGVSPATKVGEVDAADAVVPDDGRAWIGGGNTLVYWDGQSDVVFDETTFGGLVQPNTLRVFDGDLYMTGLRPGFPFGFVARFNGFPHGDSDAPEVRFDVTNPQDLAVTDGGNTVYVARAEGYVDVYVKNGGGWKITHRLTATSAGLRGLAVDFSDDDPIVYAIDAKTLWKVVDKGANARFRRIGGATSGKSLVGIVLAPGGGAPEVRFKTPRKITTTRGSLRIRGTAVDANGVKRVSVTRGRNGKPQTATGTTDWRYDVTLRRGLNVFYVSARDTAGNESKPLAIRITRN
jgi:hypothetical protein